MRTRRAGALACGICSLVAASGCSAFRDSEVAEKAAAAPADQRPAAAAQATDTPPPATTVAPTTTAAPTTTVVPTTTTTTTTTTSTTTTTIPMPPGVHDAACARVIQRGDSLSGIADAFDDPTVTAQSLAQENGVGNADAISFGDLLDVCPGNKINDITGEERRPTELGSSGVAAQQRKLNELFEGYGLPALATDGVSGPFTRQRLCAARMALHLPISRAEMTPGSEEERVLMSAQSIAIPANAPTSASRWVMVSKTCQVLFAGEGDSGVKYVFKASTGEPGWETRTDSWMEAFRYDPALENDGWHNSTKFPVPEDNPLNGNMYRPIYFHRGQAIHGANNVPPEPASKGCVRVRPENQDLLVSWLGLDGIDGPTYSDNVISLVVGTEGAF